jgi:D-alanyl-D-alanine dipeptidase
LQDASIPEISVSMPAGFRALFIVLLTGLVLGALIMLVERARSAVIGVAQWTDSPRAAEPIADDVGRHATELPAGFAYLADAEASIGQDIRYAGAHNFVGRPVDGYLAGECVLTQRAAQALKRVQAELSSQKLSLIVWDCYRPARAVRDFLAWSNASQDAPMKAEFFPGTDKAQFVALGYVASRSAHSRGSTVDLAIVPGNARTPPIYDPLAPLRPCTAPKGERFEDGTLDFGTGYDCFDPLASTLSPGIAKDAIANRLLLQSRMRRAGFKPYAREWWHFQLVDEPFPQQSFDFPIVPR